MTRSVVIAAGGTGGHIYPGLAVAGAIRALAPDTTITFVGTPRGLEGRLIPEAGWPLRLVGMTPFVGWRKATLPLALVRSAFQARAILRETDADVAVGMGGYASIPLIVGARMARVPSVIHESGAIPGRANLVAARVTGNVALAWPTAAPRFPASLEPRVVGMPLNPEIAGFDRAAVRPEAREALGVAPDTRLVVVSGGSQGAASLNRLAVGLAERWRDRDDVRILLKPGRAHIDVVQAELDRTGGAKVCDAVAYFDRMDHAYAAADLAVMRAGAGTVAELAVCGVPSILVPYPFASDDHQTVNAGVLADVGGAIMVPDAEATPDHVAPLIERLLGDPDELARMGTAALGAARPRAAEEMAAWVLELAEGGTHG